MPSREAAERRVLTTLDFEDDMNGETQAHCSMYMHRPGCPFFEVQHHCTPHISIQEFMSFKLKMLICVVTEVVEAEGIGFNKKFEGPPWEVMPQNLVVLSKFNVCRRPT